MIAGLKDTRYLLLQRVRIRCCRFAFFHASDFASGGVPTIPGNVNVFTGVSL